MTDYKPNSNKSKQPPPSEKKKIEKVIQGTAKTKKKSELKKFKDVFISEDIANVKGHIVENVVIPTAKQMMFDIVGNISDMIKDSFETAIFGDTRPRKHSNATGSRIMYDKMADKTKKNRAIPNNSSPSRVGYSYDDIFLTTRYDADTVLKQMEELIAEYEQVTVLEAYGLAGITGNYTDDNYGWTSLYGSSVQKTRDGYLLRLPKAKPLK